MEYKAIRLSPERNYSARFSTTDGLVTKTTPSVTPYAGRKVDDLLVHLRLMGCRIWTRTDPTGAWHRLEFPTC